MKTEKSDSTLPPLSEILAESGLYKQYDISAIDSDFLNFLLLVSGSYDLYCLDCKRMSIFEKAPDDKPIAVITPTPNPKSFAKTVSLKKEKESHHENRDIVIDLVCSRNSAHRIKYFLRIEHDTLMKIGQYPSLADLQLQGLDKYNNVLEESERKEFARAIDLNANGIGIGAFVYLRRIFENLIEAAHKSAFNDADWDELSFQKGKAEDRIKSLKAHLPDLLVANASVYAILSKGIHSVSEQECLGYFNALKVGIELVLDEKIEIQRKEQHKKQLDDEKAKIQTESK
jgi:hypothetical protein